VASLDLAVGLRATRWDVVVSYPKVVQVPREVGTELRAIVGPDVLDCDRSSALELAQEVDGRLDGVMVVDLQDAVPRSLIYGRELVEAPRGELRCFTSTWTDWPGT